MIPAGFRLRKLARALAASILLVALLFHSVAPPASAASEIFIDHSVEVAFPVAMAFKVVARSTSNITKLRLHYRVERQNEADVTSEGRPQFEPGNPVNAQWVWDMRRGGLPPGAMVRYWWTAEDATGNRVDTQPVTVSFEDRRYQWQSITSGPVTLLWYNGAREFADVLMDAAQQSLSKMRNEMGATPERKVRIFIYGSTQELQGATLFPQEWTG
ncbi:MAG: peptidase MA domain-containing protein, partial [Chloroflexi bacterium]|nr:peptidase MA domain-containing protein [Chloroflexota bacterium]